jgi:hypothetical protein
MRTAPSLDPRISLQPPFVLYLSSTCLCLGLSSGSGSGGGWSFFDDGLDGGSGGGSLGGGMGKAWVSKPFPDQSEMEATQGAKW